MQAGTCMRSMNVFIKYQGGFINCVLTCGGQAHFANRKPKHEVREKIEHAGFSTECVSFTSFMIFHNPFSLFLLSRSSQSSDDSDEDVSHCVLVPRGCPPSFSPTIFPSTSPSIAIPAHSSVSCSPHGTLVFSSSPTSCLPPLPCGSAPRRNPSPKHDVGSLRLSHSNRNSAVSLLSTSTGSDTSYILGR